MRTSIFHAVCFFFLQFLTTPITAQVKVPVFGDQHVLAGYHQAIKGESIRYFSVYPDFVQTALLTRCTDGNKSIEWETDTIPLKAEGNYVYFTWIAAHSTGSSKGDRQFNLYINDQFSLQFTTHQSDYPDYWTFGSKDSTRLVFELKKKDGANDAHGIAYLRVPLAKFAKGQPLRLKIVGQHQESPDWFMTFTYRFEEKIDVAALPFLLKDQVSPKTPLLFAVLHFGKPATMELSINGKPSPSVRIQNGMNSFEIPVDAVAKPSSLNIKAHIGKQVSIEKNLLLYPVVKREIYLIHHSHTDIGYSHIQEEVAKIHTENIRDALKLIKKTEDYPNRSRFVWNIESLWAVENFLQTASAAERKEFFDAIRNKRIGLSAFYANVLTGICNTEELDWLTDYGAQIRKEEALPIRSVMMSDIPGINWSMVSALAKKGIRYFSNGPNYMESLPDHGDRIGATIRELGDKPFWWKSPDGKDSILLWTAGKGYSSWHGFAPGAIEERGPKKIAAYLEELIQNKYPYSIIQWRYNIFSDNGKTDETVSDFVKHWNEKYLSPGIRLATVNELFEDFEKQYGKNIPSLSGDITPYWEDGAYSTALEETEARLLSQKISTLMRVASVKKIALDSLTLYRAKKNMVLWHEHTWGSWNSISDPDNPFTIHQWNYKKSFLDSAKYYAGKLEAILDLASIPSSAIEIVNTLPFTRSGLIEINVPEEFKKFGIENEKGAKVVHQHLSNGKTCFWAADIPASSSVIYHFRKFAFDPTPSFSSNHQIRLDSLTGAIHALEIDGKNWADPTLFKGIGQAIYVKGYDPRNYFLSKRIKQEWIEHGPVKRTRRITCSLEGTNELVYEITELNGCDDLYLSVIIDKKSIREKESIHIAFPLALKKPLVRLGIGESFIGPEAGQIKGANKDFYSVQKWIDVSDEQQGLTLISPQGALFEIGSMTDERLATGNTRKWKEYANSASTVFLYALNNYWTTNYKADQNGIIRFDVKMLFHKKFDPKKSLLAGTETLEPLWAHVSGLDK